MPVYMEEKGLKLKTVHLGAELERVIRERKMTKLDFARLIGIHPATLGSITKTQHMNTKKLLELSERLGVNFFALYAPETSTGEIGRLQKEVADLKAEMMKKDARIAELEEKVGLYKEVMEVLKKK